MPQSKSVVYRTEFRNEDEPRFNVSGWSGPCSNLWWSIGDIDASEFIDLHLQRMNQCGLTTADIYQAWDDLRATGSTAGRGRASYERAEANQQEPTTEGRENSGIGNGTINGDSSDDGNLNGNGNENGNEDGTGSETDDEAPLIDPQYITLGVVGIFALVGVKILMGRN